MADADDYFGHLPSESDSLSPLPNVLRSGLTAVAVIASISLASTTVLFAHLTYKLATWHVTSRRSRHAPPASPGVDLALGLAERHFGNGRPGTSDGEVVREEPIEISRKREPNQFVVLLYNLLLADMHQSMAFFLNAVWVGGDAIHVRTGTCWMQGLFVSTGDLSASLFITAIACHTYASIVKGWRPPRWILLSTCILIWVFNYGLVLVGLLATNNGKGEGGFYVRASAWCWMNESFENLRLLTHYLFIFISLAITSILYVLIFLSLRRQPKASIPSRKPSKSSLDYRSTTAPESAIAVDRLAGHHPAFLVYPIIYVICTLPLALGRIATMTGANVPLGYFCAAGALITSNGWLDVLLWGSTRRSVIFGAVDDDEVGLETFTFMRTPHNRRYGNMVWVEGAGNRGTEVKGSGGGGLWVKKKGRRRGERSISQESLRGAARADMGMAIQMDLVTTVVIEVEGEERMERGRLGRTSREASAYSSESRLEKDVLPRI